MAVGSDQLSWHEISFGELSCGAFESYLFSCICRREFPRLIRPRIVWAKSRVKIPLLPFDLVGWDAEVFEFFVDLGFVKRRIEKHASMVIDAETSCRVARYGGEGFHVFSGSIFRRIGTINSGT